jgi:hypothetical protein
MTEQVDNGVTDVVEARPLADSSSADARQIRLDLEVDEANALHQWLLKSMHDGATALDDPLVSGTLQKLSHGLEFVNTVDAVRQELEGAGFDTVDMDDDQVAGLARRIREANGPRSH